MNSPTDDKDTDMELDDMKTAWQTLDRRLGQQHALNLHLLRETRLDRMRAGLRALKSNQILQLVAGLVAALVIGRYWIPRADEPVVLASGLLLHAYTLMIAAFAARDLVLLSRVDASEPVVSIQKRLAELRAWRLRSARWFMIAGCLMWVPLVALLFHRAGLDLWRHRPGFLAMLVASGVACLGLAWGLATWSRRPGRVRLRRFVEASAVGRGIADAQAALDEIERFERD